MGLYINPEDMSKEEFLLRHGYATEPHWPVEDHDKVLVAFSANDSFTMAAVCFDQSEYERWSCPSYRTFKLWFLVDKKDLPKYVRSAILSKKPSEKYYG